MSLARPMDMDADTARQRSGGGRAKLPLSGVVEALSAQCPEGDSRNSVAISNGSNSSSSSSNNWR